MFIVVKHFIRALADVPHPADGVVMNLPEFIRMEMAHQKDSVSAYGQLLDEGAFRQLCSHPQHRSTATELS